MNTFGLIMFDLDGTLVETAPEICDAVNDTLRQFDLPEVQVAQVSRWIGHGTRELLVQALASSLETNVESVRASDTFTAIAAAFDLHYQSRCGTRSHLYPQVRETLLALRSRGVKLAVVTNKESRFTQTVLNVHQLTPLLDLVVSGDSLPTKKPDPAGIESCLSLFDMPRSRALLVGDSSIDVATARNADVAVWAVPYGYNMGQPIEACAPDRVIADCSLLLNL
jgi:phosphoglycolate phosphatase